MDHGLFIEKADGNLKAKVNNEESNRAIFRLLAQRRSSNTGWETISLGGDGRDLLSAAWWAIDSGCKLDDNTERRVVATLQGTPALTRSFQPLANMLGVPIAPGAMMLELTLDEQRDLIWEPGDTLEIISGTISFTAKSQYRETQFSGAAVYTQQGFFFESSDSFWGTKEWFMTMEGEVPNGPALLIIYKRGSLGNAFGIVSMVNRAWLHLWPFRSSNLMASSSKMKELSSAETKTMIKGVAGLLAGQLLTGGLLANKGGKMAMKSGVRQQRQNFEQITGTARAFMHRVAKNADEYWQVGGNSTSGKL